MEVVSETVSRKLIEEAIVQAQERNDQDICIKAMAKQEEMNRVDD